MHSMGRDACRGLRQHRRGDGGSAQGSVAGGGRALVDLHGPGEGRQRASRSPRAPEGGAVSGRERYVTRVDGERARFAAGCVPELCCTQQEQRRTGCRDVAVCEDCLRERRAQTAAANRPGRYCYALSKRAGVVAARSCTVRAAPRRVACVESARGGVRVVCDALASAVGSGRGRVVVWEWPECAQPRCDFWHAGLQRQDRPAHCGRVDRVIHPQAPQRERRGSCRGDGTFAWSQHGCADGIVCGLR
mmetsp:Transcript_19332/g.68353  ORF Transcript_19332/g.68353 Transcript_19332/m.68353 type:complete len:247 (+) Transcript_19332:2883-3623(+)